MSVAAPPGASAARTALEARAREYTDGRRVRVEHLSDDMLTRLLTDLDRTARPCGCQEGAAGASAVFLLWPLWVGCRRRPGTLLGWVERTLELVPVTASAALIFKRLGIKRGRAEHDRLRRSLTHARTAPILRSR